MLWIATISLWAAQLTGSDAAPGDDFTRSYAVIATEIKGQCLYFITDNGMNSTDLRATLSASRDTRRGLEILTFPTTPKRCVDEAWAEASRAGFKLVRERPVTAKDHLVLGHI